MGYFYVKVIEARKVAVRTSFFVNYPFIRLIFDRKEKRSTNYKPGIEWWDKIIPFKVWKETTREMKLTIQARDKSIHVFGSDWIGETTVDIKELCDGYVHQKWIKLGKGEKFHNRPPRGFVHLAFQYIEEGTISKRPFAESPQEPVLSFEEWLASAENNWIEDFNRMKEPEPERSRKVRSSTTAAQSDTSHSSSIRGSNEDTSSDRKIDSSSSYSSDNSTEESDSKDFIPTGDLIDLSFDSPGNDSMSSMTLSSSTSPELSNSNSSSKSLKENSQTNPFSSGWYNDFSHSVGNSDPISPSS